MSEEIVDLISDDEPELSLTPAFTPDKGHTPSSPVDAAPDKGPTRAQLRIAAMFDGSDSDEPSPSPPIPAAVAPSSTTALPAPRQPANVVDAVDGDSSDESDEEIVALLEQARRTNTSATPGAKLVAEPENVLQMSTTGLGRALGNRVEAPLATGNEDGESNESNDAEENKENEEGGISAAFIDCSSNFIVPSLCEGPEPTLDDGPKMDKKEMLELVQLNKLSADATVELPTPTEMNVVLLKHQRQALAWMRGREKDNMPPGHPRGGILADDQGFGKTLSVAALMLTNKPAMKEGATKAPAWGNLVICPTSIMYQWAGELENRIDAPYKPRVLVYHGQNRPRDPFVLVKYDVVITSYGMARQEFPKELTKAGDGNVVRRRRKGPLYKLRWFRIILDEAQAIKNHRSETFAACTLLQADRRWSLTGTPIQNTLDDIYSQFLFIRYFLVSSYREWYLKYKRPLESARGGPKTALFKRFQAMLGVVLLRRAKSDKIDGKPIINLPKRTVVMRELEFSAKERAYYNAQEERAVVAMQRFGIEQGFTTALVILLRLRQACGHPALCDWDGDRQFDFSDSELDSVDERMKTLCLFNQLPPETQERLAVELGPGTEVVQNCPICMDVIEDDGIVTKCGHIFCTSDFEEWIRENETCPFCRTDVSGENDKMTLHGVREEIHALDRSKQRRELQQQAAKEAKAEPRVRKFEITIGEKRTGGVSANESPTKRRCKGESALTTTVKIDPVVEEDVKPDHVKEEVVKAEDEEQKMGLSSTKIMAFIAEFKQIVETTEDKVLIFSQFCRMLDLVEERVNEEGFEYVRLDGTMTPDQRTAAISMFNTRSKCRLFLISLQAGSTGLNLTAANRVFLLDSWWNPMVEEQVCLRVSSPRNTTLRPRRHLTILLTQFFALLTLRQLTGYTALVRQRTWKSFA